MKTKLYLRLLVILGVLFALQGCKKEPQRVTPEGPLAGIFSTRCFWDILEVQNTSIIPQESSTGGIFSVRQQGKFYTLRGNREENKREHALVADQIGDYESLTKYVVYGFNFTRTTTMGIKQIEAIALTDYDERHREGSTLTDILKLSYISYDKSFIHKTATEGSYYVMERVLEPLCKDFEENKYFKGFRWTSSSNPELMDCEIMRASLTSKPTGASPKVKVRITLSNNQVIEQELEIKP